MTSFSDEKTKAKDTVYPVAGGICMHRNSVKSYTQNIIAVISEC